MVTPAMLMWGILFGAIGIGYLVYGKQQKRAMPLLTGVLLILLPYFISSTWLAVILGALLVAAPFIVNKLNS